MTFRHRRAAPDGARGGRWRGAIAALLPAVVAIGTSAPSLEAMGRAPRLDLRAIEVRRSYGIGDPITFTLELRNRGNAPQTILAIDGEMLRRPERWVDLEFVVSRASDGAGFRIFPARHGSAHAARDEAPVQALEPRRSVKLPVAWANHAGWHWLHERDRAQLQLAGTYDVQPDVVSGCFDRPGLYHVRAIATVQVPESAIEDEQRARYGPPWKGRLVSIPFTILIRNR